MAIKNFYTGVYVGDNLGIGIATPASKLHVNGNVLLSNNNELRWLSSTGTQESILELNASDLLSLTAPGRIRIVPDGNAAIDLFSGHNTKYVMSSVHSWEDNNSNVALRITAGGNVGINTANPTAKLDVVTTTYANAFVDIQKLKYTTFDVLKFGYTGLTGSIRTGTIDTGIFGFAINTGDGTERVRIDTSGNVGISTTTPEARLHVVSATPVTGATGSGTLVVEDSGNPTIQLLSSSTRTGFIDFGDVQSASSGRISYNHLLNEMSFSANNAGGMSIDSAANVRIGGASANAKLDVNGGVKVANDTDTAGIDKVGTLRYRYVPGSPKNFSYVDMCMQTGTNSYAWVNIVQNVWN